MSRSRLWTLAGITGAAIFLVVVWAMVANLIALAAKP